MRLRTAAVGVALAIFGLGAAVGIGLAANSISGDSVGLSAEPLSAGDALAPRSADDTDASVRARREARERKRRAQRRADREEGSATAPAPEPTAPTVTAEPVEPDDDHGGRSDSSGPGSGDDDGGSDDNSGPGGGDD